MKRESILLENLGAFWAWLTRRRGWPARIFGVLALLIALPLAGLALLPAALEYFAPPLDMSQDLYAVNRPIAFTFVDADGKTAGHRGAIVGDRLKLEDMPSYLPAAFIAMEDRRFYSHSSIDIRGLLRALWLNWRAGHVVAGGSTITQQTAKIVFLNPERTYARKIQELMDAASLEKSLSKKQILELYLNRIYLGSGAYGVDGAAHVYFGKSARELSLSEAAMLATLTTAPSVFSPRRDLARAQARADRVLGAMVETGAITKEQAAEARAHPAVVTDRSLQDSRNFYLDTAADEALRVATVNGKPPTGDLVVRTALDPAIQEHARHALIHLLAKNGRRAHASEGAIVLMKPDGAVTALIGGKDYDSSVFNRATQARRQPGSAFKPFVYLTALENGISPWDVRSDGPVDIDGWAPTNYGGRSYGTITLASALAHSVNTITASLAQEVGVGSVVETAQRLGIKSPLEANASLALGTSELTPLELTTAYAVFANGGYRVDPYLVTEVDDSRGHVLYKREQPAPKRVVAAHVNRDLVAMLYGVVQDGTGRSAAIPGHEAAGKTGTTQDYHDAWFVGFTADYVCGVWLGNDDSSPMRNVTGGTLPAALWKSVMTYAEQDLPGKPLDKSTPQPPADENGIITAETGNASIESANDESASGDDESAAVNSTDEDNNNTSGSASSNGGGKSWWDWLFSGDSKSGQPAQTHPRAHGDETATEDDADTAGDTQQHTSTIVTPRRDSGAARAPATSQHATAQAPVRRYSSPEDLDRDDSYYDDEGPPPPPQRIRRGPAPPADIEDEGPPPPDNPGPDGEDPGR